MKKIIAVLLVFAALLTLTACGGGTAAGSKSSNDNIAIEGIYVDNSYVDKSNSALKMVYVFLSINATDSNISADCSYAKMTINNSNTYESTFYKGACDFAPSYYYSSFIEEVYTGTNLDLVLTFKVPEGDLKDSKKITFSDTSMPFGGIEMSTDDIVFCASAQEVCEKGDPEGYATESEKHAPADAATTQKVKNLINGYYWTFYLSVGTSVEVQEIEFSAPNKFVLRSNYSSNGGTYEVKNAYIYVTYSTNGATYKIPYEFKDGDVALDCATAFSIYE